MSVTGDVMTKVRNLLDGTTSSDGDTLDAMSSSRNVTFDLNNERTRQYEEEAISPDHDTTMGTTPPAYSRTHRDSGVSVGNETCESRKLPTITYDAASEASSTTVGQSPTQPRRLSTGPFASSRPRRLSADKEEGRRPSLGPAMDRWRLEEEKDVREAKRRGKAIPPLSPPLSPRPQSKWPVEFPSPRSPFEQIEGGRRMSLGLAMEQWRLEELDGFEDDAITSGPKPVGQG
ncbi:hypothetical protein GQ53DRAFT_828489 [Thozetella sp. PMI_491]|nr:hypothetical protein GQ53DRAFT_828489 [Thozetella sp. PMI_491]